MPKVPESILSEIKSRRPLAAVLEARGVVLHKQGVDLVCCCPLPEHDDRTPSFHLTEDGAGQSVAHCFGCDWAGNVFQLLQHLDRCSFVEAVATAAAACGVAFDSSRYQPPPNRRVAPGDGCPLDPEADDAALSAQVIGFYHNRLLRNGNSCWAYLHKRGLADMGLIRRFQLGYAERGVLGKLLPDKRRVVGHDLRSRLEGLDWFKADSGHETFSGRFVVPILDADGLVVGCYGRALNALKNEAPHKYQKGGHRGIWNAAAFRPGGPVAAEGSVVLCEALIDALTFARHGLDNVTAAYGTNGFLPEHVAAFTAAGVKDVFMAFDADAPGETAVEKIAPELIAAGMTVYRVALPPGGDVNDLAVAAGTDAEAALADAVNRSSWLGGARPVAVPAAAAAETPINADNTEGGEMLSLPAAKNPGLPPGIDGVDVSGPGITVALGNRRWRLLGLEDATDFLAIKVGLRVSVGEAFHQDKLDLANHRSRAAFVSAAGDEVPVQPALIKADLKKLLLYAEQVIDEKNQREAAAAAAAPPNPVDLMSDEERAEALALLNDPKLTETIVTDLEACGLVGERVNKLTAYLAATSRRMDAPLAVLVQSSSAAGKTSLMDAIIAVMPEEDARRYSALSPKALYYLGPGELSRKILAIAEEEGAEAASYSLKLLQSDGSLVFACPMKQADGSIRTEEVRIDGPIQLFLTTTASAVADAELENRCIKLTVDEDAAQTAAIHAQQRARDTWEGLALRDAATAIQRRHRNAQRLLKPVVVINPYAPQLTFATDQARLRRDHRKYLDLIKAVTFLHQYQRPRETRTVNGRAIEAVITTPDDIRLANDLAHVVLGRCLDDLPPQARRLLGLLWDVVQPWADKAGVSVCQFPVTTRQLLPLMPYGLSQLRSHLAVLVDQEYVMSFRRHAAEPVQFQLAGDERPDGRSHVCLGLIDPATIDTLDQTPPAQRATPPDRYRAVTGSLPGRNRIEEIAKNPTKDGVNGHSAAFAAEMNGRVLEFCNVEAVVGGR